MNEQPCPNCQQALGPHAARSAHTAPCLVCGSEMHSACVHQDAP